MVEDKMMIPEITRPTEEEIDRQTAKEIFLLTGGIAEELKLHREAILSLWVLTTGVRVGTIDRAAAQKKAEELDALNQKIVVIIERGRILKKAWGIKD